MRLIFPDSQMQELLSRTKSDIAYLAKDHGAYICTHDACDNGNRFVVFAKGCNPEKDENVYDRVREGLGGDDFVETLRVSELKRICSSYPKDTTNRSLVIDVTRTKYTIYTTWSTIH